MSSEASAMDYAVQVAAMRSQQNAIDLAKGLRAQGIKAYWIGKSVQGQGVFYRVRIGRFSTIESAYLYAEELMEIGVFSTYAIAAYEPPTPATLAALAKEDPKLDQLQAFVSSTGELQSFVSPTGEFATMAAAVRPPVALIPKTAPVTAAPKVTLETKIALETLAPKITVVTPPARAVTSARLNTTTIDMIASIGTRGWLLLSSDEVIAATQKNPTALGRELAKLAAAVGSRRWSLNGDISKLLAPSSPASARTPASAAPVSIADLARENLSTTADRATPAPAPAVRATSSAISAPEIGRRPLPPTSTSPTFPGGRSGNYLAPPRLQGSIELREGRMWLTLRNLDPQRSFSGSARITLTSEKDQQDIAPLSVNIAPGQETNVTVTDARVLNGDWMMMVFDQGGVARLVRGASLAPKPAAPPAGTQNQPAPNPEPQGPPGFVTGVIDSTGEWSLSETGPPPSQAGGAPAQPGNQTQGQPTNSNSGAPATNNGTGSAGPASGTNPASGTQDKSPPQVSVAPRQLSVTPENVMIEFDVTSSRPLNYVVLSIRAGDFTDTRQALMSMPQGRVPFMIPANFAKGPFSYELKDETGKVLASGMGDFRQFE